MLNEIIKFFNLTNEAKLVNIAECFSDNDGNFLKIFIMDNGEVLMKEIRQNHPLKGVTKESLASKEEIEMANELWISQGSDCGYRHSLGRNTYIGCEVILQRSRLAPNKTPLMVEEFYPAYFDRFGRRVNDTIRVTDGNDYWVVQATCIKQVTKGRGFL